MKFFNLDNYEDGYKAKVKLHENVDGTHSIGVLNNPNGIPDSTKSVIHTLVEKSVSLNTLTPLVSIRNDSVDKNLRYGTLSLATEGSKPVLFSIYIDGVLTGASFVTSGGDSFSSYDTSATAIDVTGLNPIGGLVMQKVDSARINLFTNDVFLKALPNETITLCAESTSNTAITLFLRHLEDN